MIRGLAGYDAARAIKDNPAAKKKLIIASLDDFQRHGLYGFDRSKVENALPASTAAVGKALKRLAEKGRGKRLSKGFHAIVPFEYATQGIPPSD